jgi:hypothetical protein
MRTREILQLFVVANNTTRIWLILSLVTQLSRNTLDRQVSDDGAHVAPRRYGTAQVGFSVPRGPGAIQTNVGEVLHLLMLVNQREKLVRGSTSANPDKTNAAHTCR